GMSVANIGDLDGDGINDLGVGANRDDMDESGNASGGTDRGAVHIMFVEGTLPPSTSTSTDSTSTGGGGGGSQSCNSRGFGVGKSLAVYEVSYNFCGDTNSVDILAYSTCGSISAQLTTEYGRSTAGLSLDQPFIDDEITVYTGILRDDIKKFTVKMENKRNSFEDTFVINECKTTKRYSQTTGYTSSQQGTFGDNGITISVPQWVKNTAGWWAEDKISEDEFVKGIEFLVKERIIDNLKTGNVEPASSAVPTWVKNNAGWWAEGQIDDNSFVKGIEYLVKVGLIQVT
ncbi:integrin alpha, partial [Candidatus Nitrosopelagicus sp.]|nr:integrin alpha [Candidatus Nitrosopelagicus sp.]